MTLLVHFEWNEIKKVAHYYLPVNAMTQSMQIRENILFYGDSKS
jgi:hypothetical protein